ncbi:MAG: hypothetical protein IJW81_10960, partial [Clostridia bacterium]|nr:hypothetical protein [Clostridia bacterium]
IFQKPPPHHINFLYGNRSLKRFWKGFGETFSSKRFPQEKEEIRPTPKNPPITLVIFKGI